MYELSLDELAELHDDDGRRDYEMMVLWELLRYAHDNTRTGSFDYDTWAACCEMLLGKRTPWPRDGVRANEMCRHIDMIVLRKGPAPL